LWAVTCAERVLPVFERQRPEDGRPRAALETALVFAQGEIRVGVAHMAAHARGAAWYALKIVALAQPDDPDDAASAVAPEDAWHRRHLPPRFLEFVYPPAGT
jgi:hypothetical protein